VGKLAGGIAHDFNNLLTAINGYAELALARAAPESPLEEFLLEIRKGGDRAASLTRQLLAYSRKQILAAVLFDLNDTVVEMLGMLKRSIGEDVDIAAELDPGLGKVKADPGQVQQIILNPVVHAREALPRGGRIRLRTANIRLEEGVAAAPGPHAALAVSDDGVGMPPEVKTRVFEPVFTTKPQGRGTGLGLSSVYGIATQSGGGITVRSDPGFGSTFTIYLPREAPSTCPSLSSRFPEPTGSD
jgi:signal transduction histidine kinase